MKKYRNSERLDEKPGPARNDVEKAERRDVRKRPQVAAQKERRRHRRDDDHVGVLGEEEQREAHAAVLGMEPAGQLLLRLGQIEGRAVGLGQPADDDQRKRQRLHEDEPGMGMALRLDDADHAERAGDQHHAHQRERHRDFVADELSRRAQAGEQRKLAVRGVARQDDPVDADRGDADDIQQADIDIGDVERDLVAEQIDRGPERNDRVDNQRRHHRDDRRGGEHPLVGAGRRDVFLDHQLHRVGDRLQDAERSDAHRPEPRLRPGNDFALEQHHVGDRDQRRVQHDDDLQQRDEKAVDHYRSTSPSTMSIDPMSATTSAIR